MLRHRSLRLLALLATVCAAADLSPGRAAAEPALRESTAHPALVIAHRGASGYLPEHTLPAYAMGYAQGSDYIEIDVCLTRDRVPVALHDHRLDFNTNVRQLFPSRARKDGYWYAADFSLEEVRQLAVRGRRPQRFRQDTRAFRVPTLPEIIELVQELNRLTGRDVGLYVETKFPAFHQRNKLPLEETILATLRRYGYRGPQARVYIESFEADSLKKLRDELGTRLPLVQLLAPRASYDEMQTDPGLDAVARYANGIGPSKKLISADPSLVKRAKARNLFVHAFTFRADDVPEEYASFAEEIRDFYFRYDVDGLFTDHPDRVLPLRDAGPPP